MNERVHSSKVTVIIPCFPPHNKPEKLVASIKKQSEMCDIICKWGGDSLTEDYNKGIIAVETPYTLLMQQDCLLSSENQIECMVRMLEENPEYVAVTAQVHLEPRHWLTMSFWGRVLFGKFVGLVDQGISGKCDLIRTPILQKIGGYDTERFKYAGDDVDLYLRLSKIGTVFTSWHIVVHKHNGASITFREVCRKRFHWGQSTGALFRRHGFGVLKARYASNIMHHINKWLTLSLPVCFVWPYLLPVYVITIAVFDPVMLMFHIKHWPKLIGGNFVLYLCDLAGYMSGLLTGKQTHSVYSK